MKVGVAAVALISILAAVPAAAQEAEIAPAIVYFAYDDDTLTPAARENLARLAAQVKAGDVQVSIAGHADRSGSQDYNVGLSHRRAANVRSYLASQGVKDGVMLSQAFGENRPAVDTADGVREPLNRRAEITVGPGSGW